MIGYRKDNKPIEFNLLSPATGRRFDRIELTVSDFVEIGKIKESKEDSARLVEWLHRLQCRLSPDAK